MAGLKSLVKDTAIYGVSSIVGRFLNWCLVPMYTRVLKDIGDFGVVTNLYGWTALILTLLTFGMETTFFRFINKPDVDPKRVYATSFSFVTLLSLLFLVGVSAFLSPISEAMGYAGSEDFILMIAAIVAMDAISAIPFAYLRYQKRPLRFAYLKTLFIAFNIALNLFFFIGCPWLSLHQPEWVNWFYNPNYSVGYAFVANLIGTAFTLAALTPEIFEAVAKPDPKLLKQMVKYSAPLLVLGIAGILNMTVDKILFPFLIPDKENALYQLGIYGANFRIAMVMILFTQAFRFAYEPFVFSRNQGEDKRPAYVQAMKYFLICILFLFLAITGYMDLFKLIVSEAYWEGLAVVPIVMVAEMFFGIFFNLSFWYKLSDRTQWGAYFSLAGCLITVLLNILLVPKFGYIACAYASLVSYGVMMVASYIVGQRIYPIAYDLKSAKFYTALTLMLFAAMRGFEFENQLAQMGVTTLVLLIFVTIFVRRDVDLKQIPYINRLIKR